MSKSIFLTEHELARVEPGLPHGGREDGEVTLNLTFRTTPGHQTGGDSVSAEAALELAHRILLHLEEQGQPTVKSCELDECGRLLAEPYIEPKSNRLVWLCAAKHHPVYA